MFRHKLSALLNLYHTQIHVCSFSKMELPWNCTIPRQHEIQFSFIHNSIPTHPKSGKFQRQWPDIYIYIYIYQSF